MKKKILSLALCLSLLLSLGALVATAERVDVTSGQVLYANYGAVEVDGTIDNAMQLTVLSTSQKAFFGATWTEDYLYVGMSGVVSTERSSWGTTALSGVKATLLPLDTATVTLENTAYSIQASEGSKGDNTGGGYHAAVKAEQTLSSATAKNVTGKFFVELAIPMADVVLYDLGDGTLGVNVKLTYYSNDGTSESWNNFLGVIALCDTEQIEGFDVSGEKNYDIVNGHDRIGAAYYVENPNYVEGSTASDTKNPGKQVATGQVTSRAMSAGIKSGVSNYSATGWPESLTTYSNDQLSENATVRLLENNSYTTYLPTAALTAGKHIVAQQDILLSGLPVADLTQIAAESSTGAWAAAVMESNATNPGRALLVVGMGSGNVSATSNGYVIYNTANGLVLYDDVATNSVALGVNQGAYFNLRLELDADRNTDVYVDSRYVGTIEYVSPNTKAFVNGVLFDGGFQTSVTVGNSVKTSAGAVSVTIRNPYVAQETDSAVAALNTLKSSNLAKAWGSQTRVDTEAGTYDIRFLFELPVAKNEKALAQYAALGYDITVQNAQGQQASFTVDLDKVFESVDVKGENQTAPKGGYIAAAVLWDIPAVESETVTVTFTPWVITANAFGGEKTYAAATTATYTYTAGNVVIE